MYITVYVCYSKAHVNLTTSPSLQLIFYSWLATYVYAVARYVPKKLAT